MYSNAIQQLTYPLMERLTKCPFDDYIRRTILQPLGMTHTGWLVEEAGEELALGYQARYTPQGIEDLLMEIRCGHDALGGESGMASLRMITTIGDTASPILNRSYEADTQAKLLRHLQHNPHFPGMAVPLSDVDMSIAEGDVMSSELSGSGARVIKMGHYLMAGHSGACAGYRAHMMRVPKLGFGIGVLTNSTEGLDLACWIESWVIGQITSNSTLTDSVHAQRVLALLVCGADWQGSCGSVPECSRTELRRGRVFLQ